MTLTKELIDSISIDPPETEEVQKAYDLFMQSNLVKAHEEFSYLAILQYPGLTGFRLAFYSAIFMGIKLGKKLAEVEQLERL